MSRGRILPSECRSAVSRVWRTAKNREAAQRLRFTLPGTTLCDASNPANDLSNSSQGDGPHLDDARAFAGGMKQLFSSHLFKERIGVVYMKDMNAAREVGHTEEPRSLHRHIGGISYSLHQADCLEWMALQPAHHVHAIVTDPPYGLKEYTHEEKKKLRSRHGGIWRIPPSYDGCQRSPVPRFTVLTNADRARLKTFFLSFAERAFRILTPGGHLFIASSPLLSHLVYAPLMDAGFEKRGEVIRLV